MMKNLEYQVLRLWENACTEVSKKEQGSWKNEKKKALVSPNPLGESSNDLILA